MYIYILYLCIFIRNYIHIHIHIHKLALTPRSLFLHRPFHHQFIFFIGFRWRQELAFGQNQAAWWSRMKPHPNSAKMKRMKHTDWPLIHGIIGQKGWTSASFTQFFWQTWRTFFCNYLDWNYWCLAELQAKFGWVFLFCFATFAWWGGVASLRKLVSRSNCRASQAEFCCKRTCFRSQNGRPQIKIR